MSENIIELLRDLKKWYGFIQTTEQMISSNRTIEAAAAEIERLQSALAEVVEQRGWQSKEHSRLIKTQDELLGEIAKYHARANQIEAELVALATKEVLSLTPVERRVLIEMLEQLREHQADAGCNDFAMPDIPENRDFSDAVDRYCGREPEVIAQNGAIYQNEWEITAYLIDRIKDGEG